ncbi:magnesium-protoporphyrin IX monomethyl ester (oxidative) cyclase [Synechococcus sp. CS-602]|uniref:magnesium-protoporphyrin IX monomethyl ester (oxidative) cyclase n=1 Tax=Synechococcaceae TaxID=1890426 RepID=UPI0008FF0C6D|nr:MULTISPECIES: magnesium-protoporphyrin IX monomethyl ester (oxidative) cyclase [Synechococcaceae]MCT4365125.1 magnesium-protoporphyrin IX monomethyl ester (oxidative) cyclase [Candidatus Regnicoccus frigidus MAG-AL1]APD47283.1 magnesium-protoporphyrin IX monomethyl ester aerobic oxidative cyclase [Synechococcus sp. SynAce01]MCT0202062.1 magnesium-protoporphyrin IX monomethyl ester (oxidative) cyclase [Synechococcus sp. CS-603]MCT0205758.1 magnesium-protoporphyrin IX monomethyl ester (oxidati
MVPPIAAPSAPAGSQAQAFKEPVKDTILTPRFYTTDFDAMAAMDLRPNEVELEAICEEFRKDYNRHHFVRNAEFDGAADKLDPATRKVFVEFLEQSCTSEFSGFLLYKELSRRIKEKNPLLAECFAHMARDEARHAGFLNKSMGDFGLQLDLGFLTANKAYTFFQPKFIFYATYLSEKIGYWRYIAIYRHLQQHPESKIFPIFNFFENWCQDENRHGDFFDALMKAQPDTVRGLQARLWCRFFLLAVFATMYVRDVARKEFYEALGLDARSYDKMVIEKTNETSAKVFPVVLNVAHPKFYERLERIVTNNSALSAADQSGGFAPIRILRKLPFWAANGLEMAKLFLMAPIRSEDFQPAVR